MAGKITIDATDGPMKGKSWIFTEHDTFIVGRDADCHARLPENDTTVSRRHFVLELNPPNARIRDLGSRNGTYVNDGEAPIGRRGEDETAEQARARDFPQVDLGDGDVVRAGASVFRVGIEKHASCNECTSEIAITESTPLLASSGVYVCGECRARALATETEIDPTPRPLICDGCGSDVAAEVGDGRRGSYVCKRCRESAKANPVALLVDRNESTRRDGIGGYTITKLLGAGGMGAVYLARRDADGERVAVKVLLANVAVNQQMRQVFAREIETTKGVRHPNVVRLYDHGSSGASFYFVMELCAEGSVLDLLHARGGKLSLDEALPLALSALEGLAHLHDRSIVHRDLKPANVLIAEKGVAKISDLGLAKNFAKAGLSGLTVTGATAGTLYFMAREQITHYKYVKPPSDVFAFGATLYHVLTGRTPREHPFGADPIQVILEAPSIPIREREPDIPPRIAEVIDKACASRAETRWATAREMKEALERAL